MVAKKILSFYNEKKVLVTGHTGFKGSWLSNWLHLLGAEVTGYSLDPKTDRDNFNVSGIAQKINDIRADIRNIDIMANAFHEFRPEIVFHLAAQPIVRESYTGPKITFDTNIGGTVNLLECCRLSDSVREVIIITSDKCYDNKEWIWGYREEDAMGGYDPYSASKGATELVAASYRNSFFNPHEYEKHGKCLSTVRAGNVIGGGDWATDRIVPDCIRALEAGKDIIVRNPHATRPWQHVLDALSGYLLLGARMRTDPAKFGGPWNFGPYMNAIIPVKELVEELIRFYGTGSWKTNAQINQPHEAKFLALDINKAIFRLGWKPSLEFEDTVRYTVEWYKASKENGPVAEVTGHQIETFSEKLNWRIES